MKDTWYEEGERSASGMMKGKKGTWCEEEE